MLDTIKSVYEKAPFGIRRLFDFLPQPFVFTPTYRRYRSLLSSVRACGLEEVEKRQRLMLADCLIHCITTVPFYRKVIGSSVSAEDIRADPLGVLNLLPVINKGLVSSQPHAFISEVVPERRRYLATTGGSTGAPFGIWLSNEMWAIEWAFIFDYLGSFGISHSDRRISLRGTRRLDLNGTPYEFNPIYREFRLSPFHLTSDYVNSARDMIRNYKAKYLHGYPSAVRDLIVSLGDEGIEAVFGGFETILLVSESISASEIEFIQRRTGVPVSSFYGHSERACFAPFLPTENLWVPHPLYGVTEVVDSRLVCTGLLNKAMPLLRYDTEDEVVSMSGDGFVKVGSGLQSISGRWDRDYMIGKSDQRITMTALNSHIPELKFVRKFQFFQERQGSCSLRLVLSDGTPPSYPEVIRKEFESKCGGELDVSLDIVDDIPLSRLGKHSFIVRL